MEMTGDGTSIYQPLPVGQNIRLLELEPLFSRHEFHALGPIRKASLAITRCEIKAQLRVYSLEEASQKYNALSYVWGKSSSSRTVTVCGQPLMVTDNAYDALNRARYSSWKSVLVWIDAICINQQDPLERASQVEFMHRIYEQAEKTLIFLGHAQDQSDGAIRYARTLDTAALLREYIPYLQFGATSGYWERKSHILDVSKKSDGAILPAKQSLINSCARLFLRPWFSRVWTQQEGAVGQDTVALCGDQLIEWDKLFALAWLFLPRTTMAWPDWFIQGYQHLEPNLMSVLYIQRYRMRKAQLELNATFIPSSLFVSLLQNSWRQQATDPRDKVFAMRNLASDLAKDDWAPKPNYSIAWQELFTQLAIVLYDKHPADTLGLAGTLRQVQDDSYLPSFVPDWRQFPRTQYLTHPEWSAGSKMFRHRFATTAGKRQKLLTKALHQSHNQRIVKYTLCLTTLMHDTISFLGGTLSGWDQYPDEHARNLAISDVNDANSQRCFTRDFESTYIDGSSTHTAYFATLIARTTDVDGLATESFIDRGSTYWRVWIGNEAANLTRPEFDGASVAYNEALINMDTFHYKQFCVTDAGYYCLVPSIAEKTDIVAIIKGYDMPVLLRPVLDCYLYIGDCYVHGMMEFHATTLIEEFSIKIRDGQAVWKPEGDVRANGKSMDAGEYKRILHTLGERTVELV